MAEYSLSRARERLKRARLLLSKPDPNSFAQKQQFLTHIRSFTNSGSQIGDARPVAFCE
jgi:U4/U6 small nuclear ribonucleoprotein PRP4